MVYDQNAEQQSFCGCKHNRKYFRCIGYGSRQTDQGSQERIIPLDGRGQADMGQTEKVVS